MIALTTVVRGVSEHRITSNMAKMLDEGLQGCLQK